MLLVMLATTNAAIKILAPTTRCFVGPAYMIMLFGMAILRCDLKVFKPVVDLVAIDMMHHFIGPQMTANRAADNPTMLINPSAWVVNRTKESNVTVLINSSCWHMQDAITSGVKLQIELRGDS